MWCELQVTNRTGCNLFSCIVVATGNKCSCCQSTPVLANIYTFWIKLSTNAVHVCGAENKLPNSSGSVFLQHFSWSVFISTCGPKEHFHLCLWGESDQWHSAFLGVRHCVMSSLCHLDTLVSATNAPLCNTFIVRVLASAANALLCNIFIVWVLASATNALM